MPICLDDCSTTDQIAQSPSSSPIILPDFESGRSSLRAPLYDSDRVSCIFRGHIRTGFCVWTTPVGKQVFCDTAVKQDRLAWTTDYRGQRGRWGPSLQFFAVMNFQITATIPHATKQKMMRKMASVQRVALADSSAGNEARPLFTKCRNIFRSLPILVRPLDFGSFAGLLPIFLH